MNRKILLVSIIVLALDQVSKIVFDSLFKINYSYKVIKNFFYITVCHNKGAAFSLFSNSNWFILLGTFICLIIIYRFICIYKQNIRNNIAFGLILGGLFGNLLDRIIFGYVRDFFDFYIIKYDYPVFNVADITIVLGVLLLVYATIKGEDKKCKS